MDPEMIEYLDVVNGEEQIKANQLDGMLDECIRSEGWKSYTAGKPPVKVPDFHCPQLHNLGGKRLEEEKENLADWDTDDGFEERNSNDDAFVDEIHKTIR